MSDILDRISEFVRETRPRAFAPNGVGGAETAIIREAGVEIFNLRQILADRGEGTLDHIQVLRDAWMDDQIDTMKLDERQVLLELRALITISACKLLAPWHRTDRESSRANMSGAVMAKAYSGKIAFQVAGVPRSEWPELLHWQPCIRFDPNDDFYNYDQEPFANKSDAEAWLDQLALEHGWLPISMTDAQLRLAGWLPRGE